MPERTRSDENWALARTIQLTPSREGLRPGCYGVIAAEPHAAGWFISAHVDPDVPATDVEDFAEFTAVRTYLLLEHGPRTESWERGADGVWRAYCVASELDLSLEPVSA